MQKRKRIIYKPVIEDENSIDDLNLVFNQDNFKDAEKVEILSQAELIDFKEIDESIASSAEAALGIKDKQEDLLYVKFKLVHANTNKNRDTFLKDELVKSFKTPILKLINWNHKEPNIGVIFQSKLVEPDGNKPTYIECIGAIQKYKYSDYAKQIVERHENKKLYFSMETWFKEAQCSICDEVFKHETEYCAHLKNRFVEGSNISRKLYTLTFCGAGIVENPADVEAESLAIASQEENELNNSKAEEAKIVEYTQESVEQMVKDAVDKAIADLRSEYDAKLVEASEKFVALDVEKTSLVTANEELKTKLVELETKYNESVASVEAIKLDGQKERSAVVRFYELNSIGYETPSPVDNADAYNELLSKLKNVDDASFELMKEVAKKVMNKKMMDEEDMTDEKDPKNKKNKKTKASEDDDNPIVPTSAVVKDGEDQGLARVQSALANLINPRPKS